MRFSKIYLLGSCLLFTCLLSPSIHADYATSEGLGNPNLVLEDETTRLSLFNLGNPAGLAFLPKQDRFDLSFQAGKIVDLEEFTTNEGGIKSITIDSLSSSITSSSYDSTNRLYNYTEVKKTVYYLYQNVTPDGTTLTPHTVYSSKQTFAFASLPTSSKNLYQGVRFSPSDQLTLQLIPLADWQTIFSSDIDQSPLAWQTGGWLRGAYQLEPNLALGAGVRGTQAKNSQSGLTSIATQTQAEFGFAYRAQELFDDTDIMDLGITLQAGNGNTTTDSTNDYTLKDQPLSVGVSGIYTYKSVMDIGLNIDYLYNDTFLYWDNYDQVTSAVRKLAYELQFRVRLPMIRDDDLRFGVSFNNHSVGHPYPTGTLQTMNATTGGLDPLIRTTSSGISIGGALVPVEGSIIALQYNIGSSLSRQDGETDYLSDSGYTNFTFGVQYQIIKGLYLRASYVDQRTVYESEFYRTLETTTTTDITYEDNGQQVHNETITHPTYDVGLVSAAIYTKTGNFGISVEDGPWKISLNAKYGLTTYSPSGWSISGKPIDVDTVNKDKEEELSGILSLTWMF